MFKPCALASLLAALVATLCLPRVHAAPERLPPPQEVDRHRHDDDWLPLEAPEFHGSAGSEATWEPLEAPPVSARPINPASDENVTAREKPVRSFTVLGRFLDRCLADALARELTDDDDESQADDGTAESPPADEQDAIWRDMFGNRLALDKPDDALDYDPVRTFIIDGAVGMAWLVWLDESVARTELTLAAEGVKLESLAGEVQEGAVDAGFLVTGLRSLAPAEVVIPPIRATELVLDDGGAWRETPCVAFAARWWETVPSETEPLAANIVGTLDAQPSADLVEVILATPTSSVPPKYLEFARYGASELNSGSFWFDHYREQSLLFSGREPFCLRVPIEFLEAVARDEIRLRTRRDYDRDARQPPEAQGFGGFGISIGVICR